MSKRIKVLSVNISTQKGTIKEPVSAIELTEIGVVGDAHSGEWHRQVSLLGKESFDRFSVQANREIKFGEFAENITTIGIELVTIPLGSRIQVGNETILEVTQIGKECHNRCAIYQQAGDCIMPREGIFARAITGGKVKTGDKIRIL